MIPPSKEIIPVFNRILFKTNPIFYQVNNYTAEVLSCV